MLTSKKILKVINSTKWFYVHKYKWSHDHRRKLCKRLEKQGQIKFSHLEGANIVYTRID